MKKALLLLLMSLLFSFNSQADEISSISIEKQITGLYVTYFQRAIDYKSLNYWKKKVSTTNTQKEKDEVIKQLSARFAQDPLFVSLYSKMSNREFVEVIYQNTLGESRDKKGITYFRGVLDNGMSRSDMIALFIKSILTLDVTKENFPLLSDKEIESAKLRKKIFLNRIEVALAFTLSLKEFTNITNNYSPHEDPAYLASKNILRPLYINPFDTERSLSLIKSATQESNPIEAINNSSNFFVSISGRITYAKAKLNDSNIGLNLNYDKEIVKSAPKILVKILDENENILFQTFTNENGEYLFPYINKNIMVKVRAYAMMKYQGLSSWNIKVVDNTNGNAVYVSEGDFIDTKESDNRRDLKILLKNRKSAPFSILNDVYLSMKKIMEIENTLFPPLTLNWSVNNISVDGKIKDGQIGTSFFDGKSNIYILGDIDSDADEFDSNVLIHEWGHYFQKKFSRDDSIGGSHAENDTLDIRVAFSEGFGNAWSAIVRENPIYSDTIGNSGWSMNIEKDKIDNPGWWSETSVQKILYDLYDGKNEHHDQISLGLKPIYKVLKRAKNTRAFVSIFSFITLLKEDNSTINSQIDNLLEEESIESIENDIYGSTHHALYRDLGDEDVCLSTENGVYNKLLNHKYIRFTIDTQKRYTIRVEQVNAEGADPDFSLYGGELFLLRKRVDSGNPQIETTQAFLHKGDYILDISDYANLEESCFKIRVE